MSLLKDTNSQLNNIKNNTGLKDLQKQSMNFKDAFKSTAKIGIIAGVLRRGFNTVKDITSANIDMIETTNLFEVQMGKVVDEYGNLNEAQSQYYTKAMAFQDKMNEKLATNKAEMQKYQAMYYGMLNSQLGSNNRNASYLMSESLTKAGYDIASLYNLDVETAMDKLKSGLAGQIESLRQIGIDISEASLARVLDQVGIDRSVQQLSYAEKEVARYIAICQQAGQAQGDFARTFEQPANQIRVFKNQLLELKQVAGSFFVGLLGQIMPIINGIIMAIKEVLKALGAVFGFEVNTGNSSLGAVADTVGDIDSGIGSATKKAKEFKKQLMGFDEINNITLPSENNGGTGGGGTVNGIDSALLDALKEWDNKMDSISGKAQEIRDKILDWLGFTRDVNGNLKWSWEDMNGIAKVLSVIAGVIGGIFIIGKLTKLVNWLKTLFTILKTGKGATTTFGLGLQTIGKVINGLKTGFSNVSAWIGMVINQYKIFRNQGNGIISSLKLTNGELNKTGQGLGNFAKKAGTLTMGLTGIVGGSALSYKGLKDLTTGATNSTQAIVELAGGLGIATASGVVAGSQFGTTGMIIGGLAGFISSTITAIAGYKDGIESLDIPTTNLTNEITNLTEELDNNRKAHEDAVKSIKDTWENQELEAEYARKLAEQLDDLVDANGRVKTGNEERVKLILNELNDALGTEYELNGNLISKNGEVVKSYEDLQKSIADTIESKKEEARETAITELYKESIKEQIQAERDLQKAREEAGKAYQEYQDLMSKGLSEWTLTHDENCKQILQNMIDTQEAYDKTQEAYKKATDEVTYYNQEMTNNIIDNTGKLTTEMVTQQQVSASKLQEMVTTSTESWEQTYDQLNTTQQSAMLSQSTTLDNWSPTIQQKWADMAKNSSKNFLTGISNVDKDVQSKILSAITTTETITPDMVSAWSNLANTSFLEYAKAMSKLEPNVQDTIIAMRTKTEGLTPELKIAWETLATESKDRFNEAIESLPDDTKLLIQTTTNGIGSLSPSQIQQWADMAKNSKKQYENNLNGLDTTTSQRIQSCVDAINNKKWTAEQTAQGLADAVERGVNTIDTTEAGAQAVAGVTKGINDNKNSWSLLKAVSGVVSNVTSWFKSKLGIASPSKVFAELSSYIPAGIAKGITDNIDETTKPMKELASSVTGTFTDNVSLPNITKELNQGIKITPKDFEIDTNRYVNYGAIKGQIEAQSKIAMKDSIVEKIKEAVIEGMRNSKITVEVEGKADKDGIFNIVQTGANEYYMQTGEAPFPAY